MLAFHNNQTIKQEYIDRIRQHQELDEIIQGKYWENGKGCAVGCTIHGSDHSKYETELGIPAGLARLEDRIFEGLSLTDAKEWPLRFLDAINPGANLDSVPDHFIIWLLENESIKSFDNNTYPKIALSITTIINLYQRKSIGDIPTQSEWSTAWWDSRYAAWSTSKSDPEWYTAWYTSWYAARSAAWYATKSDTWSAAESAAESTARSIAWSTTEFTTWSAAWSAARSVAWKRIANQLLILLKKAE